VGELRRQNRQRTALDARKMTLEQLEKEIESCANCIIRCSLAMLDANVRAVPDLLNQKKLLLRHHHQRMKYLVNHARRYRHEAVPSR
jgi:hypothetical protein